MSKRESNVLAVSFIILFCMVFGAYMLQEKKINKNSDAIFQNTQAIKDILQMEKDYQKMGRNFMGKSSTKIDTILINQLELIKLLTHKK